MFHNRKTLPQVLLLSIFVAYFAAHSPNVVAQAIPAAAGNMDLMSPEESAEDLNDLSLRRSSLFAATPIPGGVETTPDYIREFVRLEPYWSFRAFSFSNPLPPLHQSAP